MKLTIILLIVALTQVNAKSYGQLITLHEKNVSVEKILLLIENQSGYHFIYNDKLDILKAKILDIDIEKQTIDNVLEQCLNGLPVSYKIIQKTIALKENEVAPSYKPVVIQKISGTVTDDKGAPLVGASVMLKDAKIGTVTNAAGEFSIDAQPGNVLVISYLGFQTREIKVDSQTNFEVRMVAVTSSLNDIVVIGYGTQTLSNVTGAISSIKASDIKDQQITRLDDALQGRVAGVSVIQSSGAPGSGPTINVRGVTSINSSNPLYVIDGVVVDNGGIDNVNPNDITSIDVLKDAAAAIYGSRASAGVILVTTKKGKPEAPVLTYDGYYGLQNSIKKVQMANGTQYATLRDEAVTNDGGTAPFADPSIYGTGTNWQNVVFGKNVPIQSHNISVSGGSDKSTYFTSFGYLDQKGVIMPSISDYKRANFTINSSNKIAGWLTIGENYSMSYGKSQLNLNTNGNNNSNPLTSAVMLDPLTPLVVTDINAQPNAAVYTNPAFSPYIQYNAQGQPYGISPFVQAAASNPLAYEQIQGAYNWQTNILGSAFVEIRPLAGLTIRSQISTKAAYWGSNSFTPLFFLNLGENNLNANSQNLDNERNITINWDNTITYTRSFKKNNFTLLAGSSYQTENGHGSNSTFRNEPVNSFSQASPNFDVGDANRTTGAYDSQPYKLESVFGRLLYDYDQKYLLSITVRHDGSSKFGMNNIFGNFPSAEAGYIISKENFFPKNSFVNFLKIRASYGVLGNEQSLGTFGYTTTIANGRNAIFGNNIVGLGSTPGSLANPDLKWEQVKMTNIGFDAVIFNDVTVAVDAYHKVNSGMLDNPQAPMYVGANGDPYINVGNMQNRGLELSVNYNKQIGQVHLNAGGNIAYNQNKLTYITRYKTYAGIGGGSNVEIERSEIGGSYQEFYGYQELGVFHSQAEIDAYKNKSGGLIQPNAKPGDLKWADLDGDGNITTNDRKALGLSAPPYTYGVSLSAKYKQFDVNVFGQGVWGNMIAQDYRRLDYPGSNYQIAAVNAWTQTNPNSNYPRLTDNDPNGNFKNFSNFYLQSGAYFRIKTLQLGYTIPSDLVKRANMKNVRAFFSVNNLATITKYNGYDPEISGGIDYAVYPQARTFILGLNVSL